WCQRAAIDGVHRDQVDVAEVATYHSGQALGLLRTVVDALQQDVLVARAPAGSFRVSPCGADDRGDRVLAIDRDHAATQRIVGRVQGDRQVDWQSLGTEPLDERHQPDGRYRHPARAEIEGVRTGP